MGLIKQSISSLVGGVSQQTQSLRRSSQGHAQENALSSMVDGLKKRPAAAFVSRLMNTPDVWPFVHFIERDKHERYAVVVVDGQLKVFNAEDGTERVVHTPNGSGYINVPNPSVALKAVTVADYTFLVNTTQTVEATSQPYRSTDQLTATVSFNLPNPTSYTFTPDPNGTGSSTGGTGGFGSVKPLPSDSTATTEHTFVYGGMGETGPLNANLSYVSDLDRNGSSIMVFPGAPYADLATAINTHKVYLEGLHGKAMTVHYGATTDLYGSRYHAYYFTYDGGREPGAVYTPPAVPITFRTKTSSYTMSPAFNTMSEAKAHFIAQAKANYGENLEFNYNGTIYQLIPVFGTTYTDGGSGPTVGAYLQCGNVVSTGQPGPMTGQWAPNSWPLGIYLSSTPNCATGYTYDLELNACIKTGQTSGTGLFYMRGELQTVGTFGYYLTESGVPYRPGYLTNGQAIDPAAQKVGVSAITLTVNDHAMSCDIRSNLNNDDYAENFRVQLNANLGLYGLASATRSGNSLVLTPVPGGRLDVSCNTSYVSVVKGYPVLDDALYVYVKNGVADQTYRLSIGGNEATYTTGNTNEVETYKSENVAEALKVIIAGWSGFSVERFGSLLMVKRSDNGSMAFDYSDTWGNQALYVMRNRVRSFSDLPERFVEGPVIEVAGAEDSGGYYVHYVTGSSSPESDTSAGLEGQLGSEAVGSSFVGVATSQQVIDHGGWKALEGQESGAWEECAYPRAKSTLVPASMPHALIRQADGSFLFKAINWERRKAGDEVLTPAPSFVGKQIRDMFMFRNRLGIMTRDSVVLSAAGSYFNYWPTSAKQVLDDDPVDFQVGSAKVASLRNAAVFNSTMLLFADSVQFMVTAQGALTPKTLVVQPATEFEADPLVKPINSGRTLFFTSKRGQFSAVYEYDVMPDRFQSSAAEVTSHVPRYIPQDARQLGVSINEDMLTVLTEKDPNALYVLKYLWKDTTKVQEAWSRWSFPWALVGHAWTGSRLNMVGAFDGSLCLFHLNAQLGTTEGDMVAEALLDAKVSPAGVFNGTYTEWTLPYAAQGVEALITEGSGPGGQELAVVPSGTRKVKAVGDWTNAGVKLGVPYVMSFEFSQLYARDQNDMAKPGVVMALRGLDVNYHNGYHMTVTVEPLHRAVLRYDYPRTDYKAFVEIPREIGVFRVPVQAKSHQVKIKLINESAQQCCIDSVQWSATAVSR